ncbi:MAG: response regulator [Candidatus Zixiibacteriota bacterium]|nr:MAG: response regulator [candidate division Zixibacteria bacterium]
MIFEANRDCSQIVLSHINRRLRDSSVTICSGLDQLTSVATSAGFDVAIVDFPAKNPDGLAIVESLRRSDPNLAIAAVVENVTEDLMKRLFDLGCEELLVKDSSFYRVVPQLIDSLYRRRQKRVRESSVASPPQVRPAASAQRIIRDFSREINVPLARILDAADTILRNPARRDFELQNRIRNIRNAARQIKNSLEAFAGKAVPNEGGTVTTSRRRYELTKHPFGR